MTHSWGQKNLGLKSWDSSMRNMEILWPDGRGLISHKQVEASLLRSLLAQNAIPIGLQPAFSVPSPSRHAQKLRRTPWPGAGGHFYLILPYLSVMDCWDKKYSHLFWSGASPHGASELQQKQIQEKHPVATRSLEKLKPVGASMLDIGGGVGVLITNHQYLKNMRIWCARHGFSAIV